MPAVTVNSVKYNVAGSLRDQFYNISGASADTLTVGLNTVRMVGFEPGTVTTYAVAPGSIPGTSIITFTASGPFNNLDIEVIGN